MSKLKVGVALLAFNRPNHTQKVIESLRNDGFLEITAYVDAPRSSDDRLAQQKLFNIFEQCELPKIHVIKRHQNLGLAGSVTSAITDQLTKNDAMILIEDDCVVLPGFREFMMTHLTSHRDHPWVRSVCGYQYPFVPKGDPAVVDSVLVRRFNPWGWATWKDRWSDFSLDFKSVAEKIKKSERFSQMAQDLQTYCEHPLFLNGQADIWSLSWVVAHYLTGSYAISPSQTLVENIGFDGTGVHSVRTLAFDGTHFDRKNPEIRMSEGVEVNTKVSDMIDAFLNEHSQKMMFLQKPLV
jgi:hypothetical protein